MWQYARQSLIHYAKWMVENENLYLEKPEKLEYPNETWAAQDFRKTNVLNCASKYVQDPLQKLSRERAIYFFRESLKYLHSFDNRNTLTRPLALLMLNCTALAYSEQNMLQIDAACKKSFMAPKTARKSYGTFFTSKLGRTLILAFKFLRGVSIKKEYEWTKHRLNQL
ncbi:MAG: hypothetical protein ACTSX1_12100, partial [Candidatus Heimdallarchaeaceae archaeon]